MAGVAVGEVARVEHLVTTVWGPPLDGRLGSVAGDVAAGPLAATTAGGDLGFILKTSARGFYGDDWTSTVFGMAMEWMPVPVMEALGMDKSA